MKEDAMNFEPLATSAHAPGDGGAPHVTGLDTCVRKPLVATCGLDKCVRLWNWRTREIELSTSFAEEAYSVALHPLGLHVVVGFVDKLRLMSLLMDEVRATREFAVKACREVRFSNGGQQFAAVNNNMVHVYHTYSGELGSTLRGHNGKVRSIAWSGNDKFVFGAGSDGVLLQWELASGQRVAQFEMPRVSFSCVAPHLSGAFKQAPLVYAAGSDFILRQVHLGRERDAAKEGEEAVEDCEVESPELLGQIVVSPSGTLLFASTAAPDQLSTIRVYPLPLRAGGAFTEVTCHAAPITRLRISHDGSLLFACSEDGSLSVLEVQEAAGTVKLAKGRDREQPLPFAEEILVTTHDLAEKGALTAELTEKVNELVQHNEYQLRLKDMNYKQRITEVSAKFQGEIDQDAARYADLLEENRAMEQDYKSTLEEQMTKHGERMEGLKGAYENKISAEQQRFAELVRDREELNAQWNDKNQMAMEAHQEFLGKVTAEYEAKVQAEIGAKQAVGRETSELEVGAAETLELVEEDADMEVEQVKRENESKLQQEREGMLRLKGENALMKKKYHGLQKEVEDGKQEINKREATKKDLIEQIKGLEKDIQGHKKEIREREETIQDKDKRIYDLKKKNQELEKFKFVLNYKIKELKRQIEPREKEIADLQQQIEDMDHELEQYHKSNAALDLMIGELRLKMDGMQREIDDQRDTLAGGAGHIRRFRADLRECVQHVSDNKALKHALTALYKKHVQNQARTDNPGAEADVQREYNRQREYLEKSVESLKRKLAKDEKMHGVEHARLMRENVSLLREINDLRRNKKWVDSERKANAGGGRRGAAADGASQAAWREVEMQQQAIAELSAQVKDLQQEMGLPLDDDMAGVGGVPEFEGGGLEFEGGEVTSG